MATTQLAVRYRPLRIGFLVPWGDVGALVRVASINSLLWGGIRNPILPVGQDENLTRQLMKLFGVDVLCETVDSPVVNAFAGLYPFLQTMGHSAERIFQEDWHTKKQDVAVLDVVHLIDHFWRTDYRHRPVDFRSPFRLVEWADDDECSECLSVLFGRYPIDRNLTDDFRTAFEKGLRAETVRVDVGGVIAASMVDGVSVLGLTQLRLEEHGGSWEEPGVYVGTSKGFEDLVNFWNLRAAGVALTYLPLDCEARFREYVQVYLGRLDSQRSRFRDDVGDIGFYSIAVNSDRARELAGQFSIRKRRLFSTCSPTLWNGLNVRPSRAYIKRDSVLADVDRQHGRYTVSFSLPPKPVSEEDSRRSVHHQHLAAVVNPLVEFAYLDHTLKAPLIRELNEFLSREITFDPWELRVDPDGLALVQRVSESAETLYPVSTRELLVKILELAGVAARMSAPGLIADRIIHSMQGADPLEACRVFKIRGVRQLLRKIRAGEGISWDSALEVIGRAAFAKFKRLYIESRDTPDLTPQDVLRFLLRKRVLAPRLKTWSRLLMRQHEFRCPACGLRSKIRYRAFEGSWSCPFCSESHELMSAVGDEFKGQRSHWVFKRSGFFAKDNNQEGALPVILTLLQLKRLLDSSNFVFSTALSLKIGGRSCEADFVVLQHGFGDSIELGLGECKDEKGVITAQDVANLRRIAERVSDVHRIETFLILAKTADAFRPEELTLFRQLATDHDPPVLMTNSELEPYDPYEIHRASALPVMHPFTLREMARNSEFIYLKS